MNQDAMNRLIYMYAAKFIAETVRAEPPRYVEPTDVNLSAIVQTDGIVRRAKRHELPLIRRAIFNWDDQALVSWMSCYSQQQIPASMQKIAGILVGEGFTRGKRRGSAAGGFTTCQNFEFRITGYEADSEPITERVEYVQINHSAPRWQKDAPPLEDQLARYVCVLRGAGLDARLIPWQRYAADRNGVPSVLGYDAHVRVYGYLGVSDSEQALGAALNAFGIAVARHEQALQGLCDACQEEQPFGTVDGIVRCCGCGANMGLQRRRLRQS